MKRPIYFDNAATSFPKPESVYQAHDTFLRNCANPGRGTHQLALRSERAIFEARTLIADFLGIKHPERLIFTPGCTHSINMALKGLKLTPGDVVITSALEHNAVMRPLHQLEQTCGIKVHTLPYAASRVINPEDLQAALKQLAPKLVVTAEGSNVTGELIDLAQIAETCRSHRVPLMIDAAQSAGFTEQNVEELGISLWCASGHKGLMGSPGIGLLYVSPDIDLDAIISGGTGSRSEDLAMPGSYPDHLEAGTLNTPAIAGLAAGVTWIKSVGLKRIATHELALAEQFVGRMSSQKSIVLYGRSPGSHTAIVSFAVENHTADRVACLLDERAGIAVRSGLHCAALAHKTLGTLKNGLVRASFGYFNCPEEVDLLCHELEQSTLVRY